jgi:hypothetical protein
VTGLEDLEMIFGGRKLATPFVASAEFALRLNVGISLVGNSEVRVFADLSGALKRRGRCRLGVVLV